MASGALGGTLRHLRDLFHDGTAVGLGDGQLLARYAADRDEAAFEALVARHGPMVLATCRAVLKHEHDVEDAFQATFLVLARKARSVRAGDALGGWLHRVAYRAAVQASVESRRRRRREAEASAMATLDATHTAPTRSRHPVHRARGARPAARSPAAAGGPLRPGGPDLRAGRRAPALDRADAAAPAGQGPASAAGAVDAARRHGGRGRRRPGRARRPGRGRRSPRRWLARRSPRRPAGRASATAAALTATIIRSLLMTKLKIAAAGVLAAITLATAGVVAVGAGRTDEPKPAMKAPGRREETGGRRADPAPRCRCRSPRRRPTPARGSRAGSSTWRAGPSPVPGSRSRTSGRPRATTSAGGSTRSRTAASPPAASADRSPGRDVASLRPRRASSPSPANLTATTGPDGRFRLAGVGPDQLAEILVSGPTIATAQLYVMGRDGAEVRAMRHRGRTPSQIVYHARRFEYAAAPASRSRASSATRTRGRPIAGVDPPRRGLRRAQPHPGPGHRGDDRRPGPLSPHRTAQGAGLSHLRRAG